MKLDDAISNTLKGYLSKQLEPICEADPTVLADYVIALLKHEKPIDGLKALCMNQLEDFLKEATNGFVDSLFTHLTGLGLIEASQPAASEAPAPTNSTYPEAEADGDQPYEPPGDVSTDAVPLQTDEYPSDEDDKDTNFKRTTRKDAPINPPTQTSTPNYPEKRARPDYRSSNRDRGGDDNVVLAGGGSSWEKGKEPRQNDHKRRRSEDGNTDDAESRSGKRAAGAGWGQPSGARRDGFERGERGRFQGQGWDQPMGVPVGAGVGWGQPGTNGSGMVGVPAMPPQQGGGRFGGGSGFRGGRGDGRGRGGRGGMRGGFNGQNRRMPCTDYEQQGFCMRGDACPFEHPNPVVYEAGLPLPDGAQLPFDLMAGGMPMRPPFAGGFGGAGAKAPGAASEAYDPDQSALQNGGPTFPGTTPIDSSFTILPNGLDASGGRNVMRGGYGSRNGLGPRGGRGGGGGGANRNAPYLRPTRDTIVVENIPYEFCNIAKVNEYFSKFGNIINLQVDQQGLKAVVKYGSDAEGENAKNNPAPIFDNR
ncbi:RNA-binding protein 27, partial [Rhizophlyctis rosea]